MKEIPIPTPSDKKAVKTLIKLVGDLAETGASKSTKKQDELAEAKLDGLVQELLDAVKV
jgi:hypothetical protein